MSTPIPRNQARFTVDEIARATGGQIVRAGGASVGVATDSRAVRQGSAFVALLGERFDGHAFLAQAAAAGATTLVVSRPVEPSDVNTAAVVRVVDTRRALGDLSRAYRMRWGQRQHPLGARRVVAITGSAGKTTTKSVMAHLLDRARSGGVLATSGNLNNDIGVPMMLFGLEEEQRFAVLEIGTSGPGEIARLSYLAGPDVGVLTLVAAAHTERLGTLEEVAAEKGALLAALSPDGLAVVNADDPLARAALARSSARRALMYGFSRDADYRILSRHPLGAHGSKMAVGRAAGVVDLRSPLLGDAGALAIAAALAVVEALVGRALDEQSIDEALAALPPVGEGRLSPLSLADGTLVIDDSYNANPASMRSSIAMVAELAERERRRLVLVLGEMRELGHLSAREHAALGRLLATIDAACVIGVGGDAARMVEEAARSGRHAFFAGDAEGAAGELLARVLPGDLVLIKGSRGVATEKIVRALVSARGRATVERNLA